MELQDTVAELRRELAMVKEKAETREAEQRVGSTSFYYLQQDLACIIIYIFNTSALSVQIAGLLRWIPGKAF